MRGQRKKELMSDPKELMSERSLTHTIKNELKNDP